MQWIALENNAARLEAKALDGIILLEGKGIKFSNNKARENNIDEVPVGKIPSDRIRLASIWIGYRAPARSRSKSSDFNASVA